MSEYNLVPAAGDESIRAIVVDSDGDIERGLEVRYSDDVITVSLSGEEIFSGDWKGNLGRVFARALHLWGYP